MGQQQPKELPPKKIEDIKPLAGNVEELKANLEGELALPGTPEYTKSRIAWNKDALGYPSAIASVVSEKDIVTVVNYARENGCSLCVGVPE